MDSKDELLDAIAEMACKNLTEVLRISNLQKFFDSELSKIYFKGKDLKTNKVNIYIPHSAFVEIDFEEIEKFQRKFDSDDCESIILCICEPSGITLQYKVTNSFKELEA